MKIDKRDSGYSMELSAAETYHWAYESDIRWPCSTLAGCRVAINVDSNGLCVLLIDGKDRDCDGIELDAIVADFLPPAFRHLWPTWE